MLRVGGASGIPTLTLPPRLPLAQARAFLVDHYGWLRERLDARPQRLLVREGTVLPLAGGRLVIRAGAGRLRREGDELVVPGNPETLPVRVAVYLRESARDAIAGLVARHAAGIGASASAIRLRDPRARWGSCSAAGVLMFSWRLIMAPPSVLDYVVVHEVAHLRELNHGPQFWDLVEELCPGYRAERSWLRANGSALHAWEFAADPDASRMLTEADPAAA